MKNSFSRREILQTTIAVNLALGISASAATDSPQPPVNTGAPHMQLTQEWDKTFPKSNKVDHQKVTFKNRYGIMLAADMYMPQNTGNQKLAAIILSGPFGAVKEQSSGFHAQALAERGFVTLAFDPSFTGESAGEVRNVASPDIYTEDFSAAVDFIGLQPFVDRDRIGVLAICGLTGMAITAASSDSRIKAVATTAMYDMSRSMSKGYQDFYTQEQRQKVVDYLSQQRWADAEQGIFATGLHEVPFDKNGNIVKADRLFPDVLPADADPVSKIFFNYYKTPRGFHPRAINSTTAWTATTPMSFFSFPLMDNIKYVSPRPLLLVTGDKAHSRYYSEDVYKAASEPKELVVVAGADHVDLYDNLDKIPFDKFEQFFKEHLR